MGRRHGCGPLATALYGARSRLPPSVRAPQQSVFSKVDVKGELQPWVPVGEVIHSLILELADEERDAASIQPGASG